MLVVLGLRGLDGADPRTIYPATYLVESRVIAPLAVLALLTGALLTVAGPWGLRRDRWIVVELVITTALTVAVFAVLGPSLSTLSDAATAGTVLTEAERQRVVLAPVAATVLLLVNIALGVVKPRRRKADAAGPAVAASQPDAARG